MRSAYLSVISTIRFPFATFLSGGWHATYNLSREMKINPAGASRKDFFLSVKWCECKTTFASIVPA